MLSNHLFYNRQGYFLNQVILGKCQQKIKMQFSQMSHV